MTRVVGLPFRRIPQDRVMCEPWQSHVGGDAGPLTTELLHWDYNVEMRVVRSIVVDESELRACCRLNAKAKLAAVVVWRSTGTTLRGRGSVVSLGAVSGPREFSVAANIPGSLLAGDVRISTQIVLVARREVDGALAAAYAGSVLWEDTVQVALEGFSSRFPMEVVDFSTTPWAPYGGGWFLSWNSEELHEPFLRNVRLFLNRGQANVVGAVQAAHPTPEQKAIRSMIYYDVGRQLLRGALENESFIEDAESFAEGSTGKAVLRLCRTLFPADKPRAIRSTMRSRREYFDSSLQASLRLLANEP